MPPRIVNNTTDFRARVATLFPSLSTPLPHPLTFAGIRCTTSEDLALCQLLLIFHLCEDAAESALNTYLSTGQPPNWGFVVQTLIRNFHDMVLGPNITERLPAEDICRYLPDKTTFLAFVFVAYVGFLVDRDAGLFEKEDGQMFRRQHGRRLNMGAVIEDLRNAARAIESRYERERRSWVNRDGSACSTTSMNDWSWVAKEMKLEYMLWVDGVEQG